jgi:hypothetical protein
MHALGLASQSTCRALGRGCGPNAAMCAARLLLSLHLLHLTPARLCRLLDWPGPQLKRDVHVSKARVPRALDLVRRRVGELARELVRPCGPSWNPCMQAGAAAALVATLPLKHCRYGRTTTSNHPTWAAGATGLPASPGRGLAATGWTAWCTRCPKVASRASGRWAACGRRTMATVATTTIATVTTTRAPRFRFSAARGVSTLTRGSCLPGQPAEPCAALQHVAMRIT